ncbi:MAG: transglycosylase SLT domain-containing protein, partial [Magnetospirillum sp.]|nr:transglycosylase SLT domain-containing protein [Magnetospirillum sp.]
MPNGIPTIQRPEHKVAAHIRDAAEATGVPFEFLLAQANQESRLDPDAKSRRSSAMGLFQFTAGTWLEMVKNHGGDHGLDKYADAITRGSDGRLTVKNKDLKKEILDLRRDPKLSALM